MKLGRDDYDARVKLRTIPEGEAVFPVRAQDELFGETVRFWAARALEKGVPVATIEQAMQLHDVGEAWPVKKLADADHLTPERKAELEAAFALRGVVPEVATTDALQAAEQRGRAAGYAAAKRAHDQAEAQLADQVAGLRRELTKADQNVGRLLAALRAAKRFMSGFEGDQLQAGIGEQLAEIRAAIAQAEVR